MPTVEYAPTTVPTSKAKTKSFITGPPNVYSAINVRSTVPEVIIVLERVPFILLLIISDSLRFPIVFFSVSLILSKITIDHLQNSQQLLRVQPTRLYSFPFLLGQVPHRL